MKRARIACIAAVLLLAATGAFASWYDDYDAGINAARKGQWSTVVTKMSAAIAAHDKESDKERTYGAIFISYHPHYYRAVAYMNLGKYDQAVSDLEKAGGVGEENLGSIETLMARVKAKLEAANTPAPEPAPVPVPVPVRPTPQPLPVPVAPVPVTPAAPSIDPALRQRVAAEIGNARARMNAAQQRKASGASQYSQGMQQLAAANTQSATARSNDDLNAALAAAQNAAMMFDAAPAPGTTAIATTTARPTRPVDAANTVLASVQQRLRSALESYFRGDFEESERAFDRLTRDLPGNGWIWAFLGASQYSRYAFEADEAYKSAAMQSFRKAKSLRRWSGGLPQKYFSRRIRKVFETAG
jgi:tetratricopeptide (TPR) repeat protein